MQKHGVELKVPGKDYIGVGGGTLIFDKKKEKVLLKKRGVKSRNEVGWWEKAGGVIEFGEEATIAIKREVKEELGVDIEIWGYLPHTDHIILGEKQHWLALNYLAIIAAGEPKNMETEKCEKIAWFSLENLPDKIVQPTRESIENYQRGRYLLL